MILYTPLQPELILEGLDLRTHYQEQEELISHRGMQMLVRTNKRGQKEISRLLTTDPREYLKPENQPGKILE